MSENGVFTPEQKRLLQRFVSLKDGHRFVRAILVYFGLPEAERGAYYSGELDAIYNDLDERSHLAESLDVTRLLQEKSEVMDIERLKKGVETVIGGGKDNAVVGR